MIFSKKIKLTNCDLYAIVDRKFYPVIKIHGWSVTHSGHVITKISGNIIYLHNLIIGSAPESQAVLHLDDDYLNNKKSNLAFRSKSIVDHHKKHFHSSIYQGVSLTKDGRWMVCIKVIGKGNVMGRFQTEEEAARAYDKKAIELYGNDAKLNFPKS